MILLWEKLDALKSALDEEECIKKIEQAQKEIKDDEILYKKLKKRDLEAFHHEKVLKYRKIENEVNFLILDLNQHLKKYFKNKRQCHESN